MTDAKVLQEILHTYVAINRWDAIEPAFDALLGIVDDVLAVDGKVVRRAKQIVLGYRQLSVRDGVHMSAMEQNGIEGILSFDAGFDAFPRITRPAVSHVALLIASCNRKLKFSRPLKKLVNIYQIVGARPSFTKVAPVLNALRDRKNVVQTLIRAAMPISLSAVGRVLKSF